MNHLRSDTKATNCLSGSPDSWPRSAQDFADDIGVSERTIRRAIYRGHLLATKRAGVFRISRHDAIAYLQRRDPARNSTDAESFANLSSAGGERIAATLPLKLTSMIGREQEVSSLVKLLTTNDDPVRLLSLTGTGGVGKTRLAIRVAEQAINESSLETWFVPLAFIFDPDQVAPAIARSLGVHVTGNGDLIHHISRVLSQDRSLLVLDNFEHVIEAAPMVVDLILACPELRILITSRMRLRVSGEREHIVQPLSLGTGQSDTRSSPSASPEAVRLFYDRARTVRDDFDPDYLHVNVVSEICKRLDGLPLAIELAASRIKALDPLTLLNHLDNRLPILTGGGRDVPRRHREMRQTVAWSYNMLTPDEQKLFRQLGVFVGGCTLESANEVCGSWDDEIPERSIAILNGITALVDHNLLRMDTVPAHDVQYHRYSMLETIREYAREALTERDELCSTQARHARYFTAFAERTAPLLQWRTDISESISLLDVNYDNITAALKWSLAEDTTTFLRISAAMQPYWVLRGRIVEGKAWLDKATTICVSAPLALRSSVLRSAGWLAWHSGDFDRACSLCTHGLNLARQEDDPFAVAHALSGLGFVARDRGEFELALSLHEEALLIGTREKATVWIAWSMRNIGKTALMSGDHSTAETWLKKAHLQFNLINHHYGASEVATNLARIACDRDQYGRAAALLRPQLSTSWHESSLCRGLEYVAEIAVACRLHVAATRLIGAADTHRQRLGVPFHPSYRPLREDQLSKLKIALDQSQFDLALLSGSQLTSQQARDEAIRVTDRIQQLHAEGTVSTSGTHGLSRREIEVLGLVARTQTNKQIASSLFISIPTVKRHMTNILGKLDAPNRRTAVERARDSGLI